LAAQAFLFGLLALVLLVSESSPGIAFVALMFFYSIIAALFVLVPAALVGFLFWFN
jgi:hypothetical protein